MYVTNDGREFIARDEDHLVAMLRVDSFTPSPSLIAFMQDVAERARFQDQRITLRTDTTEHFVSDMIAAGLLSGKPAN